MMASLAELLAKLEEIRARRRATNIHPESVSADPTEVTANDGLAVTEEAADVETTVVDGVGVEDAADNPNLITTEQPITVKIPRSRSSPTATAESTQIEEPATIVLSLTAAAGEEESLVATSNPDLVAEAGDGSLLVHRRRRLRLVGRRGRGRNATRSSPLFPER
ncbi:unnamed protein product [Linum trigynum]|uniref:Uncharacterized protein n=1 Tax=Linum trigynum TaxID=586398 RepID=A0AAV2CVB9_9ROSI